MATARYFLFNGIATNTSISFPILAGEFGGSNAATRNNASSTDSTWLRDANEITRSYIHEGSVLFTFNAPRNIVEIRFSGRAVTATAENPVVLPILISNDGTTWQLYATPRLTIDGGDVSVDMTRPPINQKVVTPPFEGFVKRSNFTPYPPFDQRRAIITLFTHKWTQMGGGGRIFGTTTVNGELKARVVHLLDQKSMQLVATAYTKEDGAFEFNNLSDREYTVIGEDQTRVQNSVIYARVKPVFN